MIIWLKFSDALCDLTAIHGGTVDGTIDVAVVLGPDARTVLYRLRRVCEVAGIDMETLYNN